MSAARHNRIPDQLRLALPGIVLVTAAIALGMLLDRRLSIAISAWLLAGGLCVALATVCVIRQRSRWASWLLLLTCVTVGAARHHQVWFVVPSNHIVRFAAKESQPIVLRGVVCSKLWVTEPDQESVFVGWSRQTKTRFDLQCQTIVSADDDLRIQGKIRVAVTGDLKGVAPGDHVQLRGFIVLPSPPNNPSEFDYRSVLRRQNIHAVLRCNSVHAVEQIETETSPRLLASVFDNVHYGARSFIEERLRQQLSPEMLPLAESLILGKRDGLTEETRDVFLLSGSMHLLAISGLHVGILLFAIYAVLRAFRFGFRTRLLLTIIALLLFLAVTEIRPSVVRAVTTALAIAIGMLLARPVSILTALCMALLLIVMVDPPSLFDVGTHLSFHSVAAILFGLRIAKRNSGHGFDSGNSNEFAGWWPTLCNWVWHYFRDGYFVTLAVFVGTAPLIMAAFHLISPIGYLLGVFMIPILAASLLVGYLDLVVCLSMPPLSSMTGFFFDGLLRLLTYAVSFAAEIPGGHWMTTSISWTACWGYYVLLYGLFFSTQLERPVVFRALLRLLCSAVMLFSVFTTFEVQSSRDELKTTFVSVGHGSAVLIKFPNGKAVLYDAGSIQFGPAAARSVEAVMFAQKINRLDAVILSHSDIDHFNAIPAIMNRIPVGEFLLAQSSLQAGELGPLAVCEFAAQRNIDIRFLQRGDRLAFDPAVDFEILHPGGAADDWSANDNANSLVIRMRYANRSVLLPGDVEFEGMAELIEHVVAADHDIMMAPHHGSLRANPPEFIAWANPDHLVASEIDQRVTDRLKTIYDDNSTEIYATASGAVTCTINKDGQLTVQQFRISGG